MTGAETAALELGDIAEREDIERFVRAFYARMLKDPELGPIFVDVAEIDLEKHLPLIIAYWDKLLLGARDYQRHTMNIHRDLNAKRQLVRGDFVRWLDYFCSTMDHLYRGPMADRAKQVALHIARNMHRTVSGRESDLQLAEG